MAGAVDPRIQQVFKDLEAMWRSHDFAGMRACWLKDLAAPLYLAEEKKSFFTSWQEFDAYFADIKAHSRGGLVTYKPLHSTPVGQGQELVAFELEWTVQLTSDDSPIGGWVRGLALFEYDGQAWKLRAYIEAPLAPILYMRDLYKLVAESRGFKPVK